MRTTERATPDLNHTTTSCTPLCGGKASPDAACTYRSCMKHRSSSHGGAWCAWYPYGTQIVPRSVTALNIMRPKTQDAPHYKRVVSPAQAVARADATLIKFLYHTARAHTACAGTLARLQLSGPSDCCVVRRPYRVLSLLARCARIMPILRSPHSAQYVVLDHHGMRDPRLTYRMRACHIAHSTVSRLWLLSTRRL